jgi:hypothetical protein
MKHAAATKDDGGRIAASSVKSGRAHPTGQTPLGAARPVVLQKEPSVHCVAAAEPTGQK